MNENTKWAKLCKLLDSKTIDFYFKEREIWWCYWGKNIGHENNGKNEVFERPILVFRKINKNLFWGLPLTTKYGGESYKFCIGKINDKYNYVLLDQLRSVSSKRLKEKVSVLNKIRFVQVEKIILSK